MVNYWWFGLVVWIPRIPLWKGLLLRDSPRIPNHQLTISWKKFSNKRPSSKALGPYENVAKWPELLDPSISEAGIETFLQVFPCQTKTIRTQTCPVYDQWIHNCLVAPVQMHRLQLMTMLPEDILSEKFPDLFIWMQILHSWSLTARPWKVTFPKRKDRLPTIVFQGRTVQLRGFHWFDIQGNLHRL